MRLKCIVFLFALISSEAICQETDTWQPDSVYRVNKVRSRLTSDAAANAWQTLTTYDTLGRLESWTLMRDGIHQQKITYQYDHKGKQISEEYYYGTSQVEVVELRYDPSGRVEGKATRYPDNKLKMEVQYSQEGAFEQKWYWRPDGTLQSGVETRYEIPNVSISSKSTGNKSKGDEAWDYTYKNKFSTQTGRLVKRESFSGKKKIQTMLYQYNESGLLVQKSTMSDRHPPIIETFEYTFSKK